MQHQLDRHSSIHFNHHHHHHHHHQIPIPISISISPRSSFHSIEPIGSHFKKSPSSNSSSNHHPTGGSAQLLNNQSQSQSQSTSSTSSSSSSTTTTTTTTHPDLDLFTLDQSQSQSQSDPSSLNLLSSSPLNLLSSSPRLLNQSQQQQQQQQHVSPTQQSTSIHTPQIRNKSIPISDQPIHSSLPRSTTSLWMGDLESWMDEEYVRRCVVMMGWHLPHHANPHPPNVKIKMVSGASPSSAYCFLTYPTAELAQEAWKMISNMPPTLMPGCERTFKLNWATGLPGVQPTWDREFSVFIRDLDREVSEGELVSLFTRTFPSTKSAKIMGDLSTGLSRGYAFIRFGEESDMHRALDLGRSKTGTGMYLRGRSIKISEASGSSGTAGDHHPHHHRVSLSAQSPQPGASKPVSERSRHASLNLAESNGPLDPQPADTQQAHRGSLSANTTESIDSSASRELNQSNGVSNLQQQQHPIPTHSLARPSLGTSLPNSHLNGSGLVRPPAVQTISDFRSAPSAAPFNILPYQRASVCMPPSVTSPPNGLVYATPSVPARTTLAQVTPGRPPSSLAAVPLPHPQTVYPTMKHMRNSIAAPGYVPGSSSRLLAPSAVGLKKISSTESFHPAQPTPAPLSPFQIHPGVVSMGNFYASTPTAPAAGYFSTATTNANAAHFAALAQIAVAANHANNDPSNTTVFVGGLPACISEETLKTFFQNFGEITYVKIPPNKGCGFVQYVRRADAEAAMLKMHDFPIHGKSRIRLSWGRSLGDKQVEYVRKLSGALGIPFEAVWKIVEGQDHSTIKQIASAVGTQPAPQTHHPSTLGQLVDPLAFALQQQGRLGPEPARFQLEQHHPFATLDPHRYGLEHARFPSEPTAPLVQEPMRYSSDLAGRFDNPVAPDPFAFAGSQDHLARVAEHESRRLRSASEHQLGTSPSIDPGPRPNGRLSLSSTDFFPRSPYVNNGLYSSQRQPDVSQPVSTNGLYSSQHQPDDHRGEDSYPRVSPPTSSSTAFSGERNRSFVGLSDDPLSRLMAGQNGESGSYGQRTEFGTNGIRSSSALANRNLSGDRGALAGGGGVGLVNRSRNSLSTWSSSAGSLRAIDEQHEREFNQLGRNSQPLLTRSPPTTNLPGSGLENGRLSRRMFESEEEVRERESIKRSEEERKKYERQKEEEEEDQEDEWNQLEAEFRNRMKVEEDIGWPEFFIGNHQYNRNLGSRPIEISQDHSGR
ncbi:hypothetical protein CROQUDRAFT_671752 [Cronartium quercuum f. sp. fusiforme G11]|uniref:RRM domain-containing protein n=2 Tax=Pucciniales TaxID=5258 RepID=A0A9P6NEQ9_9BASI|nr:hypothetical protein CROQUDRAFT_671752 [Cronartium quercuum f. sp. fusiforme G11]